MIIQDLVGGEWHEPVGPPGKPDSYTVLSRDPSYTPPPLPPPTPPPASSTPAPVPGTATPALRAESTCQGQPNSSRNTCQDDANTCQGDASTCQDDAFICPRSTDTCQDTWLHLTPHTHTIPKASLT